MTTNSNAGSSPVDRKVWELEAKMERCHAKTKTMGDGTHQCTRRAVKNGLCRIHSPDWECARHGEFEIFCNGALEASTSGQRAAALREAMRYAVQYSHDGDVEVFEVVRQRIKFPNVEFSGGAPLHGAASAGT